MWQLDQAVLILLPYRSIIDALLLDKALVDLAITVEHPPHLQDTEDPMI